MNLRYYHEFYGADDVLNRFEILTNGTVPSMSIEASGEPFMLDYAEVKKLEPIRGSQATLNLICNQIFQFRDLHTDDMQKYQVRFYRGGALYWIGWLDSETYGEALADTPPYGVTFKASDFNITERLKYFDASDKRYKDIVPFITHLKRCFNKLDLPFQKLYIGCTTTANDIPVSHAETALHVLYMMSDNFYDEDNEPMTCREVIESILQPFGLSMVQKDANVYIYDLNTVKQGLPMKRYDLASLNYEGDETINFNLGNLHEIGFMSTDSTYEFEEMINNVTITSSLYADKSIIDATADEKNLSESMSVEETEVLKKELFAKCEEIEKVGTQNFIVYTDKDSDNTIIGMSSPYDPFRGDYSKVLYRVSSMIPIISSNSKKVNLLLKMSCYVNGRDNPFDNEAKTEKDAELSQIAINLYTVDENGTPLFYYTNDLTKKPKWVSCAEDFRKGAARLIFCSQTVKGSNIYNIKLTNSNITDQNTAFESVKEKDHGKGLLIPINADIHGKMVLEVIGACVYKRIPLEHAGDMFAPNKGEHVKNIIYNDIEIKVVNEKKEDISTDDYEFKSYVNKKVSSDYDELTLKCISANEEKAPIGKANILKKVDDHYEFQLSYSRGGQTDILERLLMCTIHSNFTTKNERCAVIIKMTENPALGYVDYNPILSGEYLVTGCTLNFARATTNLSVVGFSEDTAKLSNIPYE